MPMPIWHVYAAPEDLARAFAAKVATALGEAVERRGQATFAVSGGTTPARFFEELSASPLPWERVTITLVDERFVPPDHARSNEKLVRDHLLRGQAASARFVGLLEEGLEPEEAARLAAERLAGLPQPLDVVVLGMGTDGHTASWFPDADNLSRLIDMREHAAVLAVTSPSAEEPRLTMTLPFVAQALFVALHIEGADKREVVQRAATGSSARNLPVAAVLEQAMHPVEIFWAPKEEMGE